MSRLRPSYKGGFARNAAESANPGLWTGLVGLWSPSLGPTGLTLFDWGGRKKDGTLTLMDPATDWVTTGKGWALDNFSATDYVSTGLFPDSTWRTLAVWARWDVVASGSFQRVGPFDGTQRIYVGIASTGNIAFSWGDQIDHTTPSGLADGDWGFLCLTVPPDDKFRAYVNGKLVSTHGTPGVWAGTSSNEFLLGVLNGTGGPANPISGPLLQCAVWKRDLLAGEIQRLWLEPDALLQLRSRNVAGVTGAPAAGHPTMKRWQQIKHMHSLSGVA